MAFMDIIEVLFGLLQFVDCCVWVSASVSGAGTGITGAKAVERHHVRQEAKKAGDVHPPGNPYLWTFLVMLFLTFFFVGAIIWNLVQ